MGKWMNRELNYGVNPTNGDFGRKQGAGVRSGRDGSLVAKPSHVHVCMYST
jgi:hypothetical protein